MNQPGTLRAGLPCSPCEVPMLLFTALILAATGGTLPSGRRARPRAARDHERHRAHHDE